MKECPQCRLAMDDGARRCPRCSADGTTGEPLVIDGRYLVEMELGRGSMGVVYRARDKGLGRRVAIKIIAPHRLQTAGIRERFRHEATALAAVRHENVVSVYALGEHEGSPFFAMEWVAGQPLDTVIEGYVEHEAMVPIPLALSILGGLARGLGAIHAQGLVHRDVKPANVVIEERTGRAVLLDFGLVKDAAHEVPSEVVGSPPYMAPEQISPPQDADAITPQLDVYALGCTAFELLTTRLPYEADSPFAIMSMHLTAPVPRLSSLRPELADLDDVLARAMAKEPPQRCRSILDLANDFDLAAARRLDAGLGELREPKSSVRGAAPAFPSVEPASSRRAGATHAEIAETMPAPPGRTRILIVDDDASIRRVLARAAQMAFPGASLEILHAESGVEALRVANRAGVDLILLDYDMPQMNGVDTLAALRRLDGAKHTPAIVLTGHPEDSVRWRFELLGIREFLSKPAELQSVLSAMRHALPEGAAR